MDNATLIVSGFCQEAVERRAERLVSEGLVADNILLTTFKHERRDRLHYLSVLEGFVAARIVACGQNRNLRWTTSTPVFRHTSTTSYGTENRFDKYPRGYFGVIHDGGGTVVELCNRAARHRWDDRQTIYFHVARRSTDYSAMTNIK